MSRTALLTVASALIATISAAVVHTQAPPPAPETQWLSAVDAWEAGDYPAALGGLRTLRWMTHHSILNPRQVMGSEIEHLKLNREPVLHRGPVRCDSLIGSFDIRVVSGPPVAGAERSA